MKTIINTVLFDLRNIESTLAKIELGMIDTIPAIAIIRKQIVDMKATVYSRPSTSKMIVGRCGPRPKTSDILIFDIKELESYLICMEMDQIPVGSTIFNVRNIISDMKNELHDFAAKLV